MDRRAEAIEELSNPRAAKQREREEDRRFAEMIEGARKFCHRLAEKERARLFPRQRAKTRRVVRKRNPTMRELEAAGQRRLFPR